MKPLLTSAAILILLSACSGDGNQTVAAPEQAAASTPPPQTTTYPTPTSAPQPTTPPPTTVSTDADMYRMTAAELGQKLEAGEAVVIDVRTRVAYATEHARGAVNIPLEELGMRAAELPKDKWLVAYCT